jgi:choline dehydrogenase
MPVSDDIAGAQSEGFSIADLTIKDGKRASAARMYLYPALARPNLTALTGAQTRRVVVENGRAVGVDYVKDGAAVTARATREVIVCGGAYNSPQILMLSGIGPADEIRKHGITPVHDLPGVGKNLQEHPIAYVQFDLRDPVSYLTRLRFDRLAVASLQWALAGKGDAASQALSAIGFMRTRPELDRPDIQVFCNPVRLDAEVWFPIIKPSQGHRLEGHASLLHPESRGEVTLRSSDPSAPPHIQLNMLSTEADRRSMRDGLRLIRHLYASGPLGKMITNEATPGSQVRSDADLDAHIRRVCDVGHHPVGTCAMGQDGRSVVDPTLKVRGLEGLRVVDASVMPLVPGGNTNAPTIMVAEKGAAMMIEDPEA